MNVSRVADREFMWELKRTDPKRYDLLEKAIRLEAIRLQTKVEATVETLCLKKAA